MGVGSWEFCVLDHHHGVGSIRNGSSGGDLDAFSVSDRACRDLPCERLPDQAEGHRGLARRAGRIGGANRVAVHRRTREGRHVGVGVDVLRQHAAVCVLNADALHAVDRHNRGVDDRPRLRQRHRPFERTHRAGRHFLTCCTTCVSSGMIRRVIASLTAFSDPGITKITLPLTVPAVARLIIAAEPIS